MPSAFTIFGQLIADTSAFQKSLRDADDRLKSTTANLDKVISASNRVGDTSATVARRYDKLNDGIKTQNARLFEAANAYATGTINAQKYASILASVDKQTDSLNARLKDAKARITELSETGFTHFQNQIGGVAGGSGVTGSQREHSLINLNAARPLQGLGPVLQGLGARQFGLDETILNILIVAAREAGVLKVASQGTAAATSAAAASELAFSNAAKQAAGSQALVAAESEATAAAMTEASAQTTLFGASLISIGGLLAAGVVSIIAAKKASEDLLASSQKRLKLEEDITAQFNKQNLFVAKLQADRAASQDERDFNRFLQNASLNRLGTTRSDLQQQLDEIVRARKDFESSFHGAKLVAPDETKEQIALKESLVKQIQELDARIDEVKHPQSESGADFLARVQKTQLDNIAKAEKESQSNREAQIKAAQSTENSLLKANYSVQEALLAQHLKIQEASEFTSISETTNLKNKQLADQIASDKKYYSALIANAKDPQEAAKLQAELSDRVTTATAQMRVNAINAFTAANEKAKELKKTISDIFLNAVGGDNPFVKIFEEGAKAIERATEATRGLSKGIQDAVLAAVQGQDALNKFGQRISDRVEAAGYTKKAREFGQGYLDENNPRIKATQDALDNTQDPQIRKLLQFQLENMQKFQLQSDVQSTLDAIGNLNPVSLKEIPIPKGLTSAADILKNVPNASQVLTDRFSKTALKAYGFLPDPEKQHLVDQQILKAASGIDPAKLTRQQDDIISDAYKREAQRAVNREDAADELVQKLKAIITEKGLKIDSSSNLITIRNEAPKNARVTSNPTGADTDARYPN